MNMATFQNQKQVKFKKQTNRLYTAHETLITSKACSLFSFVFYTPRTLCWNTECLTCTQPQQTVSDLIFTTEVF